MKKSVLAVLVALCASTSVQGKEVVIEHNLGSTTLDSVPKRVVVIGHGALDALDYFGIEPIAVAKAAKLPTYLSKYSSKDFPSVGSLFEPDFEAIFVQKPDLIIVGPRGASSYEELSEIAPTLVFAAQDGSSYWESTQTQWRNLAKAFAIDEKVEKKIAELDGQFKAIRQFNKDNNVDALTVMSSGGNITTFGAQSRFAAIYKDFGFTETVKGIKPSRHGDLISFEFIQQSNPQTLFVIDRDKLVNKGKSTTLKDFDNDLVKSTKAYQNQRYAFLDLDSWYLAISGVTATEKMIADVKPSEL